MLYSSQRVPHRHASFGSSQGNRSTHKPWPCFPDKAPSPERPTLIILEPRKDAEGTYVSDPALWQAAVPFVLDLLNLPSRFVNVDVHKACLRQSESARHLANSESRIRLTIICSFPIPFTLYLVFISSAMGLPDDVTSWCRRSISEKADCRPYHCVSNSLRPCATASGSSNVASSAHSWSFARVGRPAKRSSTLPTRVFLCWSRWTPSAVLMFEFSMLSVSEAGG